MRADCRSLRGTAEGLNSRGVVQARRNASHLNHQGGASKQFTRVAPREKHVRRGAPECQRLFAHLHKLSLASQRPERP